MTLRLALALLASLLLGSGSGGHAVRPPLSSVVPDGYRLVRVQRVELGRPARRVQVVTSTKRAGGLMRHDLQVVMWDGGRGRWRVVYDARRTRVRLGAAPQTSNGGPAVWPSARRPYWTTAVADEVGESAVAIVGVPRLLPGRGRQLVVFGETCPNWCFDVVVVLQTEGFRTRALYTWNGTHGVAVKVGRWHGRTALLGLSGYRTLLDSECCPVREYRFVVGVREVGTRRVVTELADDRPWLGVVTRPAGLARSPRALRIERVLRGAPAAGVLRRGDVLLAAGDVRRFALLPPEGQLVDALSWRHAGQRARLRIRRGGRVVSVLVRLGSLADARLPWIAPMPENAV